MSGRDNHSNEFEGLSEAEARELSEIADQLRAGRYQPHHDKVFSVLHQRIVGEIEVTPLPAPEPKRRPGGLLARLFGTRTGQLAVAFGAAAAIMLAVTLTDMEIVDDEIPIVRDDGNLGSDDNVAAMEIPDDLWEEGFMAEALAYLDDDDLSDFYGSDDGEDLYDPVAYGNPYDPGGYWLIDELSDDELTALEGRLEG
jgi:hypothetical protein